jgi:hypothetical protein
MEQEAKNDPTDNRSHLKEQKNPGQAKTEETGQKIHQEKQVEENKEQDSASTTLTRQPNHYP